MHKLNRGNAPICLKNYQHGKHKWGSDKHGNPIPTIEERAEIWTALETMQGTRCAYCETIISEENRHIEHFQQRNRYPQGTFEWKNLFGSCNQKGCCGDYKDKCGEYDPADLIKPDVDNPEDFFLFTSDGSIQIRTELNTTDRKRAEETIRVFNLNQNRLINTRNNLYKRYRSMRNYFLKNRKNWADYVNAELSQPSQPFVTTIKHALLSN